MPNKDKALDLDPRKSLPPGDGMPIDEVPFDTIPGNPDPTQIVAPVPAAAPVAPAPAPTAAALDLEVDLGEPAPAPVRPPSFFIIIIRSRKGTFHPVLDKNKGQGALATFDKEAAANHQADQLRRNQQYSGLKIAVVPVA